MKKILAICSIFFTICTVFTGCGSNDTPYDSNKDHSSDERGTDSVKEYVTDAIDGVGDAGKDIIDGVTNAVGDIVDGFDGDDDNNSRSTTSTSARD